MKKRYVAIGTVLLGMYAAMGLDMLYGDRTHEFNPVSVKVEDSRFYNARNMKDSDGDPLIGEGAPNNWIKMLSDLNLVNGVKKGESLSSVVEENDNRILIPRGWINPEYDFE